MSVPRGLYAIVDPDACRGRDALEVAAAILRGGAAMLQLRMKHGSDTARLELARALASACRAQGVPFIVDDRLDIALLAKADGVHVGQDDLPVALLSQQPLAAGLSLGVSTHTLDQVRIAEAEGAHLLGFGPVFPTRSKRDADDIVGLELLSEAASATELPVVAIGGLDAERAPLARDAGAAMVACISAICGADDPEASARAIHLAAGGEPC
ncbi:MAG: thiamine phosphate synthase [Deltaproteobacteria bacterium]|nr:thiamine phosphate synthase [Deltaproteobacteria bacterium]